MSTKTKPRIMVDPAGENENVIIFHTRAKLCDQLEVMTSGVDRGSEFAKKFMSIPGVHVVQVHPYVLIIQKSPVFTRSEVAVPVQKLLRQYDSSLSLLSTTLEDISNGRIELDCAQA
jgi:hypothetical protein